MEKRANCNGPRVRLFVFHENGQQKTPTVEARWPWECQPSPFPRHCSACSMGIRTKYLVTGNELHRMSFLSLMLTNPYRMPAAQQQQPTLPWYRTTAGGPTNQLIADLVHWALLWWRGQQSFSIKRNTNSGFGFAVFICSTHLAYINTIIHRFTKYCLSYCVTSLSTVCNQEFHLTEVEKPTEFTD